MDKITTLIDSFENEIRLQHDSVLVGNHRKNNRSVKRSHKIFNQLRKLDAVENLLQLTSSDHPAVRSNAAVYCLPIAEERCIKVLEEIRDGEYSFSSIAAKYAIKNWETKQYYLWDD